MEGKRGRGRQRLGIMWTVANKLCKERLAASCLCAPKRKLGCGRAIHFGLSIAHYVSMNVGKGKGTIQVHPGQVFYVHSTQ